MGNIPFPIRSSPTPDLTWWSVGTGAWGQFDGDGNAAGVQRNLAGYFTGVDRRFGDNWLAGLAAGYTNSSLSVAARASAADINTAHFAAYAAGTYNSWNFRSGRGLLLERYQHQPHGSVPWLLRGDQRKL